MLASNRADVGIIQLSVVPIETSLLPFPLPSEAEVQGVTFDTLFKFIS